MSAYIPEYTPYNSVLDCLNMEVPGHGGTPIAGWFTLENPTKMDENWGYPFFRTPSNPIVNLVGGLEHLYYFSIQLGMSSSQLTFTPSFFRGVGSNHQPAIYGIFYYIWYIRCQLLMIKFNYILLSHSWWIPSGKHSHSYWTCPFIISGFTH